jgi:hypothetical protein
MRSNEIASRTVGPELRLAPVRLLFSLFSMGCAVVLFSYFAVTQVLEAIQRYHALDGAGSRSVILPVWLALMCLVLLIDTLVRLVAKFRDAKSLLRGDSPVVGKQ